MTGPQLKHWRESQDITLRAVAEILENQVNHTTVSRWEASDDPIPKWASDTLLKTTQVSLPLQDLHDLLNLSKEDGVDFQELLAKCIREHLQHRRESKNAGIPQQGIEGAIANVAAQMGASDGSKGKKAG